MYRFTIPMNFPHPDDMISDLLVRIFLDAFHNRTDYVWKVGHEFAGTFFGQDRSLIRQWNCRVLQRRERPARKRKKEVIIQLIQDHSTGHTLWWTLIVCDWIVANKPSEWATIEYRPLVCTSNWAQIVDIVSRKRCFSKLNSGLWPNEKNTIIVVKTAGVFQMEYVLA